MNNNFFAKIVKIDDTNTEFIINKGSADGIRDHSEFVIIEVGEEIFDPDTGMSLGKLEIVKGKVKVKHIQEKMTTIVSNEYRYEPDRKEIRKSVINNPTLSKLMASALISRDSDIEIIIPGGKTIKSIDGVKIGDFVSKIN
ncbi:hypothetical protein ACLB6C_04350 [Enterobacter hormaechei]|uniref:hypothetical protein n=1 Tax=Enterobacter hormaechei TaxID=158836 RepID=UPI0007358571|nr:hypothetical protein [Enterobacter hormaechei]EKU5354622.1 hypothetical protein [Enterobacter hormaechei]KTG85621.1 hypothetical protein ASV36_05860 [Enterobacter hormaechei subsp. steigerwaltii]KVJ91077.1 hypothetical protein AWS22_10350 [Enterobacter hormaechei subsp. steigerwaltii]KVJ98197.1 hypothetical protein AWS21_17795 [Enterobacter hormaechei subsp. steigerwaltii]HCD2233250.1 hypothetical protein [Enterobacter hormaechei]